MSETRVVHQRSKLDTGEVSNQIELCPSINGKWLENYTYPVAGKYCRGSSQILHEDNDRAECCVPQVEQTRRSRGESLISFNRQRRAESVQYNNIRYFVSNYEISSVSSSSLGAFLYDERRISVHWEAEHPTLGSARGKADVTPQLNLGRIRAQKRVVKLNTNL